MHLFVSRSSHICSNESEKMLQVVLHNSRYSEFLGVVLHIVIQPSATILKNQCHEQQGLGNVHLKPFKHWDQAKVIDTCQRNLQNEPVFKELIHTKQEHDKSMNSDGGSGDYQLSHIYDRLFTAMTSSGECKLTISFQTGQHTLAETSNWKSCNSSNERIRFIMLTQTDKEKWPLKLLRAYCDATVPKNSRKVANFTFFLCPQPKFTCKSTEMQL